MIIMLNVSINMYTMFLCHRFCYKDWFYYFSIYLLTQCATYVNLTIFFLRMFNSCYDHLILLIKWKIYIYVYIFIFI